jgi:hypothetical protein
MCRTTAVAVAPRLILRQRRVLGARKLSSSFRNLLEQFLVRAVSKWKIEPEWLRQSLMRDNLVYRDMIRHNPPSLTASTKVSLLMPTLVPILVHAPVPSQSAKPFVQS